MRKGEAMKYQRKADEDAQDFGSCKTCLRPFRSEADFCSHQIDRHACISQESAPNPEATMPPRGEAMSTNNEGGFPPMVRIRHCKEGCSHIVDYKRSGVAYISLQEHTALLEAERAKVRKLLNALHWIEMDARDGSRADFKNVIRNACLSAIKEAGE
jgi:hypothetical protein